MKEDPHFNIAIIENVQKFPILYKPDTPGYNNKLLQERAWDAIAQAVGDSAQNCKTRWQGLRSCLCRHLRKTHEDPFITPYYLVKHMEFVIPYTKTKALIDRERTSLGLLNKYETNGDYTEDGSTSNTESESFHPLITFKEEKQAPSETDEREPMSMLGQLDENNQEESPTEMLNIPVDPHAYSKRSVQTTPRRTYKRVRYSPPDLKDYEDQSLVNAPLEIVLSDHNDSDLNFLKSLLPDIKKMSDSEKCDFKVRVMQAVSDILYKPC